MPKPVNRRTFLTASAAAATSTALGTATVAETEGQCGSTSVTLSPSNVHIESFDSRFKVSAPESAVERVATGFGWAEGPAYFAAGRYLVFSDIPNNRMMRLLDDDTHLSVFREPSLNANGNTVDRQGRLYTCEQGGRVTRTDHDGTITVIADRYNGKKLNSPNDIVVASNGSVWFTDPTYGVQYSDGHTEQEKRNVFRVDGNTGEISVVVDDFLQPNGILFSPDEKKLYIIDTPGQHIRVFDVDIDTGKLSNGKIFADGFLGDGTRCDVDGNVWCSVGYGHASENGVRCYASDGALLGKIHSPESIANLTFGGSTRNRLYICGITSVYACSVNARGAAPG